MARASPAKPVDASAIKRLVQDDGYRTEAKSAFEAHTRSTAGKDVLERCRRLNEFLESDFLKGGTPQSKEQLREILGILNAGPKRPSFLDKPPVTAAAVKSQPPKRRSIGEREADQLLSMLEEAPDAGPSRSAGPASTSRKPLEPEDVDDVIGLLNSGPAVVSKPPSVSVQEEQERRRREEEEAKRRREEEEALRRKQEEERRAKARAEEEERKRRAQEEAQRQAEEEVRRKAAEEERKRRQQQEAAEEARRKHEAELRRLAEEKRRKEEEAERLRQEEERARQLAAQRAAAATALQAAVRARLARKAAAALRQQLAAATALQAAVRARAARLLLHGLRVQAFRRKSAARCIARHYKSYKGRWHLAPVRVRTHSSTGAVPLDGHAHLLAKPLRLRSTADTRLAPDTGSGSGSSPTVAGLETPSGKRTAVTVRQRVGEMAKQEGQARSDVGARAVMAGSEHRDFQEAMQAVKGGGGGGAGLGAARMSPSGPNGKPPTPTSVSAGAGGSSRATGGKSVAPGSAGSKPPSPGVGAKPGPASVLGAGNKPSSPGMAGTSSKPASPGAASLGSKPPSPGVSGSGSKLPSAGLGVTGVGGSKLASPGTSCAGSKPPSPGSVVNRVASRPSSRPGSNESLQRSSQALVQLPHR